MKKNDLPSRCVWLIAACALMLPSIGSSAEDPSQRPGRIIASDYPDLHAAVGALEGRTGEVYLPKGEYLLERTLDLSSPPGGYQGGIRLTGCGRGTRIVAKTAGQPVIDLTGTNHCIMEDLWITAENARKSAPTSACSWPGTQMAAPRRSIASPT
jgi:hypothetical protein